MTRDKDLKRLVRERMRKTGEAYTTARAKTVTARATARTPVPPTDHAAVAGMSDAAVKKQTGCDWKKWVRSLDHYNAHTLTHTEIATLIYTKYKVDGWWSQMIAVGYERIRGLRARGQMRDGSYSSSKSRTFGVSAEQLFDAWANAAVRKRWIGASVRLRTSQRPKSLRFGLEGGDIVSVFITAKGAHKCVVGVQQDKLPTPEASAQFKEVWAGRLAALAEVLAAE